MDCWTCRNPVPNEANDDSHHTATARSSCADALGLPELLHNDPLIAYATKHPHGQPTPMFLLHFLARGSAMPTPYLHGYQPLAAFKRLRQIEADAVCSALSGS
jgi:hypothetical protein